MTCKLLKSLNIMLEVLIKNALRYHKKKELKYDNANVKNTIANNKLKSILK